MCTSPTQIENILCLALEALLELMLKDAHQALDVEAPCQTPGDGPFNADIASAKLSLLLQRILTRPPPSRCFL